MIAGLEIVNRQGDRVQFPFLVTGDAARIDTDRGAVDRLGYLAAGHIDD